MKRQRTDRQTDTPPDPVGPVGHRSLTAGLVHTYCSLGGRTGSDDTIAVSAGGQEVMMSSNDLHVTSVTSSTSRHHSCFSPWSCVACIVLLYILTEQTFETRNHSNLRFLFYSHHCFTVSFELQTNRPIVSFELQTSSPTVSFALQTNRPLLLAVETCFSLLIYTY